MVDYAKCLGVTFDDRLSFAIHINNIVKKLSRSVEVISKVKPFLDTKIMLRLFYAIFHPHLLYGIFIWGSTYNTYLKKLGTLQNKEVKVIGRGSCSNRGTSVYSKF